MVNSSNHYNYLTSRCELADNMKVSFPSPTATDKTNTAVIPDMESGDSSDNSKNHCNNIAHDDVNNITRPNHPYKVLIAKAILSHSDRKLVLADIIDYIAKNYPYYKVEDSSWKNSIRHSLSLNDCFIKVGRSNRGKSNYWSIHPLVFKDFEEGNFHKRHPKQRLSQKSRNFLEAHYKTTDRMIDVSPRRVHNTSLCQTPPYVAANALPPPNRGTINGSSAGIQFLPNVDNICNTYPTYQLPTPLNHFAVNNFVHSERDNLYVPNSNYRHHHNQPLLKVGSEGFLRDCQISTTNMMTSSVTPSCYNYNCYSNNAYPQYHVA